MIALWLLLQTSFAADISSFEPFPTHVLVDSALAQSTDDGGAVAAPEADPVRLTPRERNALDRFLSGRKRRQQGLALGAISAAAVLTGIGVAVRTAACRQCGIAGETAGVATVVAGVVGTQVGAALALAGAERERRGLERLGGRQLPTDGVVLGWTLLASQVFLPGVGGVLSYGAIARQTAVNNSAYKRIVSSGRATR